MKNNSRQNTRFRWRYAKALENGLEVDSNGDTQIKGVLFAPGAEIGEVSINEDFITNTANTGNYVGVSDSNISISGTGVVSIEAGGPGEAKITINPNMINVNRPIQNYYVDSIISDVTASCVSGEISSGKVDIVTDGITYVMISGYATMTTASASVISVSGFPTALIASLGEGKLVATNDLGTSGSVAVQGGVDGILRLTISAGASGRTVYFSGVSSNGKTDIY